MEEGEIEAHVPFLNEQGDLQYATIIVQVRPEMTPNELNVEVHDAINEFVASRQSDSDRLLGYEPAVNAFGEYEYDVAGFISGSGEFFEF